MAVAPAMCIVCGCTEVPPPIHGYHHFMLSDHRAYFMAPVCLDCAANNPRLVSKDDCPTCKAILKRVLGGVGAR